MIFIRNFGNIFGVGAIIRVMTCFAMVKNAEKIRGDNLIRRARTERESLAELYRRYYERIFRFCANRLFTREAAEDVTADVFMNVARRIRGFGGSSEEDFRKWIYAIANNLIITHLRKTSRRKELLAEAAEAGRLGSQECSSHSDEIDWEVLHQAVLELKPQQQAIVVMRFLEKMPFEEIAEVLGVKQVTVRVGLTRALRKLRKILPSDYLRSN